LGREPVFVGEESPTALLGQSAGICNRLGAPSLSIETVMTWIAHWVKHGGRSLGKPTHFEARDGHY
jgi:hypothetical protein